MRRLAPCVGGGLLPRSAAVLWFDAADVPETQSPDSLVGCSTKQVELMGGEGAIRLRDAASTDAPLDERFPTTMWRRAT